MHRLSLAAGVLADHDAITVAEAAVGSGFRNVGFTVTPWSSDTTRAIRSRLASESVSVMDVEVVRIGPDGSVDDDNLFIVDVGLELGADNVLVISLCDDDARTAQALRTLCERSGSEGPRICLEFMRFTKVRSLAQACAIAESVGHPQAGVLVDTLHLARTGELGDLAGAPSALLPYSQFCDGLTECADDDQSLIVDALDLRAVPGEGALPLVEMLAALPESIPLSLEVRSKALRERYPDPVARASALLEGTRSYLDDLGRKHD